MTKIVVFGASGHIGSRVVREALSRGHQVTAVVRDPSALTDRPGGLRVMAGSALDPPAAALDDQDAVVLALGGAGAAGDPGLYERAGRRLVALLRARGAGAPRLLVVGGHGGLETAPGRRVMDAADFPDAFRPEAEAQARAFAFYQSVADVTWTYLSPAAMIAPGERTGRYRTGTDRPVVAADGTSAISTEDYAVALVDEIERPNFPGRRFTVGY